MSSDTAHVDGMPKWINWLERVAIALWLVSLALPGFRILSHDEAWIGIGILVFGLLFGWMVHGWAAYANVFFLIVALRQRGKRPRSMLVIWMLLLTTTLPVFKGVYRDEGSMTILPVAKWEWGAAVWLLSLLLFAISVFAATWQSKRRGIANSTGANKPLQPIEREDARSG